jgi:arylsulfatase A-like enzyme
MSSGRDALLALAFALGASACSSGDDAAPDRSRPSVLFVSIDSLRADHVHCYGYAPETSPTIDALAASGVRFATAVSTTSWTLPSHAAMFTGLYDSAHGVVDNGLALAENHVTLAETMKAAGYQTAGFFGGPYLHPIYGLSQGFDVYESCMTTIPADIDATALLEEVSRPTGASHADVTGPRTVERVRAWAERSDARPFFAFVHLWDVHYDYIPPKEYSDLFDPDYTGTLNAHPFVGNPAIRPDMDPRDLQHLLALYDGEIRWTDEHLRQIVELLRRKAGGAENLLIVVTADHGEEFFEHAKCGHGFTLFDEVTRVPLIVAWPGHVAPGRVVTEQVRTIDVYPTIARATNATAPDYLQGRDLLASLAGNGPLANEPALLELWVGDYDFRALRTEKLKVLWRQSQGDLGGMRLDKDPRELAPLGPDWPNVKKALTVLHELADESTALQERIGRPSEAVVQPWLQERLKQLGY